MISRQRCGVIGSPTCQLFARRPSKRKKADCLVHRWPLPGLHTMHKQLQDPQLLRLPNLITPSRSDKDERHGKGISAFRQCIAASKLKLVSGQHLPTTGLSTVNTCRCISCGLVCDGVLLRQAIRHASCFAYRSSNIKTGPRLFARA